MPEPVTNAFEPNPAATPVVNPSTDEYRSLASTDGGSTQDGGNAATRARVLTGQRFTILRKHAQGGLGLVSVARDAALRRHVALKEIRPDRLGRADLRERFLTEAEITGQLEHPGIVPIYALELNEAGEPYYVMRFIEGRTLAEAIQAFHGAGATVDFTGMTFRDLLKRYVDVCQTVAYAHNKGVIHRDLKPANVMLGEYGETLVLDWGLAKRVGKDEPGRTKDEQGDALTDPFSPHQSSLTEAGQILGTAAYMSPEQAAGRLEELGPATDVYALGAVLFELLTGQPPYGGSPRDVLRKIEQGPPPWPATSAKVPRPLARISERAMSRQPTDRYATAKDLAADVNRWLADEPVSVDVEPVLERVGRWARRNRSLVVGLTALLGTAVVGLSLGLYFVGREQTNTLNALGQAETSAIRAAKQEQIAARERDVAQTNFERAMEAVDRILMQFSGGRLGKMPAIDLERKAILQDALKLYAGFLDERSQDPRVRREMAMALVRMGGIHDALGERNLAAPRFQEAERMLRALIAEYPEQLTPQADLASCLNDYGLLLERQGKLTEAFGFYEAAHAIDERLLVSASPKELKTLRINLAKRQMNMAGLLADQGQDRAAEAIFVKLTAAYKQLVAEEPENVELLSIYGAMLGGFATIRVDQARHDEAVALLEEAILIQRQAMASEPTDARKRSDLATDLSNLGEAQRRAGRPGEAEAAQRESLAIREALAREFPFEKEYQSSLCDSLNNLAVVFIDTNRVDEGKALHGRALTIRENLVRDYPDNPEYVIDLASSLRNLAQLELEDNQLDSAIAQYDRVIAMLDGLLKKFPDYVPAKAVLADHLESRLSTLLQLARHELALETCERFIQTTQGPRRHKGLLIRASLLALTGDHEQAMAQVAELGKGQPTGETLAALGQVCARAATAVRKDAKLSPIRSDELAEQYGATGVASFRRAYEVDFFQDPQNRTRLREEKDLEPLRGRKDFQELLQIVEGS